MLSSSFISESKFGISELEWLALESFHINMVSRKYVVLPMQKELSPLGFHHLGLLPILKNKKECKGSKLENACLDTSSVYESMIFFYVLSSSFSLYKENAKTRNFHLPYYLRS